MKTTLQQEIDNLETNKYIGIKQNDKVLKKISQNEQDFKNRNKVNSKQHFKKK